MKRGIFFLLTVFTGFIHIQAQHSLQKIWQTDSVLKVPESVLYDASAKLLYVSNIDGDAGAMDGRGSIGKVGLDGKIIQVEWVTGLNAPKGMGIFQSSLYVADLDAVAVIDIKAAKITKRIKIPGAVFLNDITIDKSGVVYVSDSRTKKIHMIEKDQPSILLENLQNPNGLLYVGGVLYFVDMGTFNKLTNSTDRTLIAKGMEPSTDGIEQVAAGEWIVSSWAGAVYYVKADGTTQELLNTKEQKINSADIGYDPQKRIVYVPTFAKNSIVAYQLK